MLACSVLSKSLGQIMDLASISVDHYICLWAFFPNSMLGGRGHQYECFISAYFLPNDCQQRGLKRYESLVVYACSA
jgi:hypothetical protein